MSKRKRSRPDYTYLERPWEDFTHDELSMIASHLAGGGAFCCKEHRSERGTVTDSRRKREILADQAYERWGCSESSPDWIAKMTRFNGPEYVLERQAESTAYYLEKFLSAI